MKRIDKKPAASPRSAARRSAFLMPLEPRIMFDAAVGATAVEVAQSEPASPIVDTHELTPFDAPPAAAVSQARHEIVFIDAAVTNPQSLLDQIGQGVEVVFIGEGQNGLQLMADTLAGRTDIDAIHVLSHGDVGKVKLGDMWLDNTGVAAQSELLTRIGQSLSAEGDILLYGCLTGADSAGREFVQSLAQVTGADVAASSDMTGSALRHGDWDLEVHQGSIEAISFPLADYQGMLAAFTDSISSDPIGGGAHVATYNTTLAGVSYTYTFTTQGEGGDMAFDSANGAGNSSSVLVTSLSFNAGTTERITIERTDTADFTFNTIFINNSGGSTVTVGGYLNGVLVGSTQNVATGASSTLNFGSLVVDQVRVTATDFFNTNIDNFSGDTTANSAPTIGNLNGDSVAWPGVGSTVALDASANAALADADFGALNSGNGDWSGGSLTVQRSGTAITSDTFGFNTSGALFTVTGTTSGNLQSGGLTFATYTNTGGVLTISYTSSGTAATTALVNNVAQRITYRNDTPAGDATVRFSLSDGVASAVTADVTVTSDTIYVTNTTDTATIDITNGVSVSEAVAIAAADATGSQTISFASSLASTALTINNVTLNESLTFDMDAASGMSLTSGTITLGSGTLSLSNGTGDTATISSQLVGTGALNKIGAGTVTLSQNNNTYSGTTTISAGTLTVTGGNAIATASSVTVASGATLSLSASETIGNLSGAGSITLGSSTLTTLLTADTTFSGGISGSGSFNVNQTGAATFALTLSGTNTFTGAATLQNFGWLKLNGDASYSNSSQLRVNGNSKLTLLSDQTVGSIASGSGTASIDLGIYTLTAGSDNNSTSVAGVVSGTGNLVKQGSGTMTLSGTNTYSGTTGISAGILSVSSDSNLGSGTVTLASATTLSVTGATTIDNAIALSGDATVSNSANATLSGTISGANNLTKAGASTLTLSGSNTYSGTTVSAGTLSVASDSNLGSGTVTLASGTTLAVTGATTIDNSIALSGNATVSNSANATLSGTISGANNLTKAGASTLTLSGSNTYSGTTVSTGTLSVASDSNLGSGTVTLASGTTLAVTGATTIDNSIALSGDATVSNSASATLSGIISGANNLTKAGASTLTLSGSNTYSGTTVSAGTLSVAADSNLGSGTLTLAAGTTLALTGATTVDNAITLSGNATVNTTANATVSGNITGAGGLIKAGSSRLTLSGTDSYAGATNINAGSMFVNGALSGTSGVTVASGATLGGSGSIFAASSTNTLTVQNGGTLSPGNSPGTITINGNLGMASGSTLSVEINGTTAGTDYDQVIVNGTVDVTGATLAATHGYTAGNGDAYSIIVNDAADAVTGNFSGLSEGSPLTAGGNSTVLTASYIGVTGNDFTLTAPVSPYVTNVSVLDANGTYKIGDTVTVSVDFSEQIFLSTGTIQLTLETGATDRVVSYVSGSGTSTLYFNYTVQAGDNSLDLDYVGTSGLAANGDTIQSASFIDAVLTLPGPGAAGSIGANKAIVIDGVRPTASIVVADNSLIIGETSLVTITFSEAVTSFSNADLTIANGTLTAVSSSDGGITWTATLTPTASITDATNLISLNNTTYTDIAGNAGTGSTDSNNYAIDTARPSASIVVADNSLIIGETSLVTITFSEAVTSFSNADLTIANGTLTAVSSSDGGITWTATLTPTASLTDATNLISLNNTTYTDIAGNAGTGSTDSNNYAIDTVRPSASIVVADNSLIAGETSLVTITFSEAVTSFSNADLTIANGTLTAVSSSDGGITWTATLTPTASISDTTNLITLANTGVQDAAGNAGTGTTDSNNYAIDTARPTAAIVVADSSLSIGETSLVTITFSEAVTGFTNADLTVANGTLSAVSSSDGGITWTATLTPTASITDTTNVITLANTGVQDAAGNTGVGTTDSNNYAIDSIRPTATIVVADTALAAGETSLVTITFSEAVTGFTNADLTIANGALSAVSSSDGGITWTATLAPTAAITNTTNLIALNNTGVSDTAGNAGTGTTNSNNYAIDTQRPTATVVVADAALAAGETSLVTITFSEAVTGFTNADLTVANGSLSGLSSGDGGITWTATLTPTASITDTTNVIALANTGVQDLAGNTGTGTTDSNNYTIDTARPTAAIVVADSSLSIGESSLITITFSEAVSGFTNADLTVANGTLSAVSSSDGGMTWTATLTPTASITDTTNVITLANTGVQDAAGNTGVGTTDSNNYAIDYVRPTATIVVADSELAAGETSLVTITFSEAVTGFTAADLTVANGSLSALSSADGGVTWTATFTPANNVEDTTNIITLNNAGVTDLTGNAGTGTTDSNNFAINNSSSYVPPTVVDSPLPLPAIDRSTPVNSPFIIVTSVNVAGGQTISNPLNTPTIAGILATGFHTDSVNGLRDVETTGSNPNLSVPPAASYVGSEPGGGGSPLRATPDLGVRSLPSNESFDFRLPPNTFRVADRESAQIVIQVRLTNGKPLPNWLTFDARTGTLTGQPPAGWSGRLDIEIVATDARGNRAISIVHFDIKAQRPAPGRAALDTQFKNANHYRDVDAELLRHLNAAALKRASAG